VTKKTCVGVFQFWAWGCWVVSTQIWVKYGQTQKLGKKCN